MDVVVGDAVTLVRVGPDEDLHDAVCLAFEKSDRRHASMLGCIGSLRYVDFGWAQCVDGVPGPGRRQSRREALEVTGIAGNIGVDAAGRPSPHLHGTMFGPTGECIGGHLFEARTLITMELTLIGDGHVGWQRFHEPVEGSPPLPLLRPVKRR